MSAKPVQYAMSETADIRISEVDNPTTVSHNSEYLNILNTTSSLHNISELTWLNNNTQPTVMLNETNTVYQVLLNTVSLIITKHLKLF